MLETTLEQSKTLPKNSQISSMCNVYILKYFKVNYPCYREEEMYQKY